MDYNIPIADTMTTDVEYLERQFKESLSAALKTWLEPEVAYKSYHRIIDWLNNETDFFVCPASTKYHEAFPGGLCAHSLNVMNEALMLLKSPHFSRANCHPGQVAICALLHDVCKVNRYEQYMKNVKNEDTGRWEQVSAYRYKTHDSIDVGHGEQSMLYVMRILPEATDEMLAAIRWHMGLWDASAAGSEAMSRTAHKYPLVHLIQFADLLSITDF